MNMEVASVAELLRVGGERLPPKLWAAFVLSGPGR
jgi:hypothetical protein